MACDAGHVEGKLVSSKPHTLGWRSCFPELAGDDQHPQVIDDGWDFHVVRLGDMVVRVPRRPEVEPHARVEVRVLSDLAPGLPVLVPEAQQVCALHGSMVYPWMEGVPVSARVLDQVGAEELAAQLAAAVAAVHRFPSERATELGVPETDLLEQLQRFDAHVLPVLGNRRDAQRLLAQAGELVADSERGLVHGDLGPAHLLCDHQGLLAIIDWADIALGDPAHDLAWILNGLDRRLRAPFLTISGVDDDALLRADTIHRLGPWWEVLYGLEHHLPTLVESGKAGIEARLPSDG